MAARLITTTARKGHHGAARFLQDFGKDRLPQDHVEEYSRPISPSTGADLAFGSPVLVDMTNDILLHAPGYRQ
jgi:hypothetical protein